MEQHGKILSQDACKVGFQRLRPSVILRDIDSVLRDPRYDLLAVKITGKRDRPDAKRNRVARIFGRRVSRLSDCGKCVESGGIGSRRKGAAGCKRYGKRS